MKLTDHFTLAELCHSQTADRLGLDNTPPPDVIKRLTATAHGLEMIRALVQCPITISSGYRSPRVNAAVHGAPSSQHMTGMAADITAPGLGRPKDLMDAILHARIHIPFDQCILEFAGQGGGWVHVSFADKPRGQALVVDRDGTRVYA
jgi:hypothetical protein